MTFYRDMGTRTMVAAGRYVRAVGWLHPGAPFAQEAVPAPIRERLRRFAALWRESIAALGWGMFRGFHKCEFCGRAHGSGNFGVPRGRLLFVAPELVSHYVEEHGYAPPREFQAAVAVAPLPGTPEYREAVRDIRRLHRRADAQRRRRWRKAGRTKLAARWGEGDSLTESF